MGNSSNSKPVIHPPVQLDLYLESEFQAMDTNNRGCLYCKQLNELLLYLGLYKPIDLLRKKLIQSGCDGDGPISQAEYVKLMKSNKDLLNGTKLLRDLFNKFDKDNSGYALKSDIKTDLEAMGLKSPKIEKKIDEMDSNKDGHITYKDFLIIYFQGK